MDPNKGSGPGLVEYALALVASAVVGIVILALTWSHLPAWSTVVQWGYSKNFLSIPNWMLVFGGLLATTFTIFGIVRRN